LLPAQESLAFAFANVRHVSQNLPMNKGPQRNELTELSGATSRLDSPFLRQLDKYIENQESPETEQFNVRLLVTCLRGVRYELLQTDGVRFDGLVKITDKVLADCGWN
jgi:hypothetical protein